MATMAMPRDRQGRPLTPKGHVLVYDKHHPCARANGMILAHARTWHKQTGRCPRPGYVLHHVDEVKGRNGRGNIIELTVGEHTRLHAPGLKNRAKKVACEAGGGRLVGRRQRCVTGP